MTPCEIASSAAHAIAVLNDLTHGGGELSNPNDVRAIVRSLELIGQGLPQLYEQLARFLVIQQEDGQLTNADGLDADDSVTEVIEALAAAGQPNRPAAFVQHFTYGNTHARSLPIGVEIIECPSGK